MEPVWYAEIDGARRGPLTAEEVLELAAARAEPEKLPVWREGFGDWRQAGSVEELRSRLSPYAAPREEATPTAEEADDVARLYRRLVLLVGLWLVLTLVQGPLQALADQAGAGVVVAVLAVGALLALLATVAVTTYGLTGALGEGSPILWAILMLIPCLNLIGLLVVSNKAQRWCRRHGFAVGLLGPKRQSIENLQYRR